MDPREIARSPGSSADSIQCGAGLISKCGRYLSKRRAVEDFFHIVEADVNSRPTNPDREFLASM
jgi:hypothetical protein